MQKADTIISASWVIAVDKVDSVYENYSLVIDGKNIADVLPTTDAVTRYSTNNFVQLTNHALIPGLVNTHTHAAMTLMRGFADDIPLHSWLNERIWPIEAKFASSQFVRDGTLLAMAEMVKGGTTCFNDMYFFPDVVASLAQELNVRAVVGLIALEFPTAWAETPEEYLAKGLSVHKETASMDLVTTMLAPHAPYTVADSTFERIVATADRLGVGIHIHVHETAQEVSDSLKHHGIRPIERLRRLNTVSSKLLAVHATQLEKDEMELFAEAGASVAHCPKSNLKLASGICPVNDLHTLGVNVGIGTDGAASNNGLDMLEEIRFASLLGKGSSKDATAVSAAKSLRMATIEGAKCLGLDQSIGSLESGKLADITAIDLNHIRSHPVYDPVSQIVFTSSSDQVSNVWINGRRVLNDGELVQIDESPVFR